jgi:biotin transport system ATP-binding protein
MHIQLEEVSVSLGGRTVLERLDVSLSERRIGIIGPNGSGKSTFARLLNALVVPDHGRVLVDNLDTRKSARDVRRRVGFVFQNPDNQIVFPIVGEDLAFGLKNIGLPRTEISRRIAEELVRFGISHLAERQSHALSGGEKQVVALASVMIMRPDIVVFDEPTTLLDLRNRNRIRDTIAAMPEAAVVVTHDLDLISDFGRVLVIDGGRIAVDDRPNAAIRWYKDHLS